MTETYSNLTLPSNYIDMDATELEYDGGVSDWGWFFIGCGIAVVAGQLMMGGAWYAYYGFYSTTALPCTLVSMGGQALIQGGTAAAAVGGVAFGISKAID